MIEFYSNNATNLHHLTTHSTTCCPTKWRSCCDHRAVTSLHPMYGCNYEIIRSVHEYDKDQAVAGKPRDVLHHGKHAANK